MPDIIVNNLKKIFKKQVVLENINLEFNEGKIYGLVGHNGSGKSVLMKIICGLLYADEGEVLIDGKRIGKDIDFLPNTGVIIEQPRFIPYLSGYRNLKLLADINNNVGKKEIIDTLEKVGLSYKSKKWVGKYSLGMKQRLSIAQAIMENPSILILDEPMNGLDSEGVKMFRNCILKAKEEGKIIILASHYIDDINMLCDRILRLENGRIVSNEYKKNDCI